MRAALSQVWTITKKDLRCELRSASAVITMVLLGFLVVLVFSFSMEPGAKDSALARSGVLWAAFLFPGLLAVGRSFESEKEAQCLEGLLLCPVDRGVIYLGKLLVSVILSFVSGFLVLVFFTVLYDVALGLEWLALLGIMLLVADGLAAVGTLSAAITAGVRARGALLAVLVLPLLVPLLVAAARCSVVLLGQEPWNELGLWPALLALYDVVFVAAGFVLFDYVVEG
jgi:heme exporter protein B